jgi:hypothetical protein
MSKKSLALVFALFLFFSFNAPAKTVEKYNPYLNERFVMNALRQIQNAQISYRQSVGQGAFGTISQLHGANLIDAALGSLKKYGYTFAAYPTAPSTSGSAIYHVTAVPQRYGKTGRRSFYINEACDLRGADKNGAEATINDSLIETCTPSVRAENEAFQISALRTIASAQFTFQSTAGNGNFGTIGQLIDAGLINTSFGFNFYRGYFRIATVTAMSAGNPSTFKVQTRPEIYRRTGTRSFYIDETGVIRGADRNGQYATAGDPPIEDGRVGKEDSQGFINTYNLSAQSDLELLRISY